MTAVDVRTEIVQPSSLREAREAVMDAGRRRPLQFRGGGTKLDWGSLGVTPGLVVDTLKLDQLVSHDARDLTARVQPGVPLTSLQARLGEAGQWLACDPPDYGGRATIGGVFATSDNGPRRHHYGALRDLVIGATVVLSDGAVARSGGAVIKNVAGYDLARLFAGSFGTLELVVELVVRLHPVMRHSRTVRVPAGPRDATRPTLALNASPVAATAINWSAGAVWVRLEGRPRGVEGQAVAVRGLAGDMGLDCEALDGMAEAEAWRELTGWHAGVEGETVLRAVTLPSDLAAAADSLDQVAGSTGVAASIESHAGLGLHTARLEPGDPAAHASFVASWRAEVARLGGSVTVRRRPRAVAEAADIWGPSPSAIGVMGAVKQLLDPDRRCAPGRFVGGM